MYAWCGHEHRLQCGHKHRYVHIQRQIFRHWSVVLQIIQIHIGFLKKGSYWCVFEVERNKFRWKRSVWKRCNCISKHLCTLEEMARKSKIDFSGILLSSSDHGNVSLFSHVALSAACDFMQKVFIYFWDSGHNIQLVQIIPYSIYKFFWSIQYHWLAEGTGYTVLNEGQNGFWFIN